MPQRLPVLSARLQMAADLITQPGVSVADIGTDHAYLAIYLVRAGLASRVLACDVAEQPLANAAHNVQRSGLADRITLRLSDGLDALSPDDADAFLFTGMGGTLIVRLLARHDWIRDGAKQFIFQPMTRAEELRAFLCAQGFVIQAERVCTDEGRVYLAMRAVYSGAARDFPPAYPYIGELPRCDAPEARMLIEKQRRRLQKRADALEIAENAPQEVRQLRQIVREIGDIL